MTSEEAKNNERINTSKKVYMKMFSDMKDLDYSDMELRVVSSLSEEAKKELMKHESPGLKDDGDMKLFDKD